MYVQDSAIPCSSVWPRGCGDDASSRRFGGPSVFSYIIVIDSLYVCMYVCMYVGANRFSVDNYFRTSFAVAASLGKSLIAALIEART